MDLNNPETRKREVEGLIEAMTAYKLDSGIILTFEENDILDAGGKKIVVKPIWKWLLK